MTGWKHVATKRTFSEALDWAEAKRAAGYTVRIDLGWHFDCKASTPALQWRPLYTCRVRRSGKPSRIWQGAGVGARLSYGKIDEPREGEGDIRWHLRVGVEILAVLAESVGLLDEAPAGVIADRLEELNNAEAATAVRAASLPKNSRGFRQSI